MEHRDLVATAATTLARLAVRHDDEALAVVAERSASISGALRRRPPNACPLPAVVRLVPGHTDPDTVDAVSAFRRHHTDLTWHRTRRSPSAFATRSAAAELIGPDGALDADDLRVGYLVVAADTSYARHWHAAEEHYVVLAGTGEWDLDVGWFTAGPGGVVRVPSMAPHALRTGADPVLMLYSWTGDVTFDTYGTGDV